MSKRVLFTAFIFILAISLWTTVGTPPTQAQDWPRFLGESGVSTSSKSTLPTQWNAKANIKWKTELPGPGASSPIVSGDRVYLTCYTGYGDKSDGKIADLKRHLICFQRDNGKVLWKRTVDNKNVKDEDPFKSYITHHGYATNTPVTDGKTVFAFFGKAGVAAFDTNGKKLWHVPVENKISKTRWGSAASPILFGDFLIVNAVEECGKVFALNKSDGSIAWQFDTKSTLAYATPNLVKTAKGEFELVVAVPKKVIGLDAKTGKEKWFATTTLLNEVNAAVMVSGDIVYVYGGFRGVGSLAVRSGGKGNVTQSHVLWTSRDTSYVATPVLHDKHIYWISERGIAHCVEAETGKRIYRTRVRGVSGGRGIKFFGSMVTDGKNIFSVSRRSGTFVFAAKPEFELVNQNVIEGDESEFNGTPAISGNELLIRSNKFLYCIGKQNQ